MGLQEIITRVVLSFISLLMLTKFMGRKEISQMTLFNFISAMALGTLAGALIIDASVSLTHGLIALAGWTVLTLGTGYIDIKSQKFRTFIDGEPVIVVKEGKIMEKSLKKVQLDIDALRTMLRKKGIFSFTEIEYAIFEVDGKLSVMKKDRDEPPNISFQAYHVPTEVISDGKINKNNLKKLNLDEQWLREQLKQSGISSVTDIFIAEIQKDGSLFIDLRQDSIH